MNDLPSRPLQRVKVGDLALVLSLVVLLPEVVGSAVEKGCLCGVCSRGERELGEMGRGVAGALQVPSVRKTRKVLILPPWSL